MSARRRRKKTGTRRRGGRRARALRWLLALGCAALALGALYTAYLDYQVRGLFEGKRWALPARVYARPLELYAGLTLSPEQLQRELELIRYQRVQDPRRPGSYVRTSDEFIVHTRAFQFWDGEEPEQVVRVRLDGRRVIGVHPLYGDEPVALARLEPAQIGAIYPTHREDRLLLRLAEAPPLLIETLLLVEDRKFYQHHGLDPRAIARALWANLRAGAVVQGASTLTQQLVKNFFLGPQRTLARKINEAIMAVLLEWHYEKEEILEAYLNEIYLGQRGAYAVHGFGLASRFYFDRPLAQLDPGQLALLVALIRGPGFYDPWQQPQRARERRDRVLDLMATHERIGRIDAEYFKARDLGVRERPEGAVTRFPAFLDLVKRQLRQFYREEDLRSQGLRVFTTLDPLAQDEVERALEGGVRRLASRQGLGAEELEGAAVLTARDTGEVLALVGGRDPRYPGFNRALDASRPIGSLMKPVVYLTALADPGRYTLASRLVDTPVRIQGPDRSIWSPSNYDDIYRGTVSLLEALVQSLNVPTVRLGMEIGVERVIDTLKRLGVSRPLAPYPSLLLGAAELTPLEVTQLYQTLATGGFATPLRAIREVVSASGDPLERYPLVLEQALDPAPVFLVDRALQEVVRNGTASALAAELPPELGAAGKTGTTDEYRDSWFAGFSAEHAGVVWVGRDDNQPTGLSGSTGAMRIWGRIFAALTHVPLELAPPADIALVEVGRQDGLLADQRCWDRLTLPFIRGSEPRRGSECNQHN